MTSALQPSSVPAAAVSAPFGYSQVVPLRLEHRVRRVDTLPLALRQANAIPVVADEFAVVADRLPIVFVQTASATAAGGDLVPSALTGLAAGENLLLVDGQWDPAVYAPGYLRRYPFLLAHIEGEDGRMVACVDEPLLSATDGLPIADAAGQPLPEWQAMQQFLLDYQAELERTLNWTRQLVELQLVEGFAFNAALQGEPVHVEGFFKVSEERLDALSAEQLKALQSSGALRLAYLQLFSLRRLPDLVARRRSAPATPPATQST
jgi:hypothetical protein